MGLNILTYAAAKKYADKTLVGGGALKGKNATIDSITDITGGHRVTFKWTLDDGTVQTQYMDVMDGDKGETGDAGLGIKAVDINAQNHLIITFDDDTTRDAGELPGGSGEVISVNGKKGIVTLNADDVGALPDDTELFSGDYNDLDNLPDLTNFITNTVDNLVNYYKKTETYTKTEVDGIVETIKNGRFEVVFTLPTTDIKTNVIYLVPKPTTQTQNVKDEYINLDGTTAGWEKIGDTEIDLSGYVKTSDLNTALAAYTTTTNLTALLADKVDKVTGKGLSTNDYTNADKAIVDGVTNLAPISLVKDTVGWTGKNLLKVGGTSITSAGVTFTVNSDGSVTTSGTSTAAIWFNINGGPALSISFLSSLETDTEYTYSGVPSNAPSEVQMTIWDVSDLCPRVSSAEQEQTFSIPAGHEYGDRTNMSIGASKAGVNFDGLTFYPMIRRADITDGTWEPYHESVEEEITQVYADNGVLGAKNLLPNKATTQTINGVTFTVNSDKSVTVNGTATAIVNYYIYTEISLKAGKYIISGTPNSIFKNDSDGVRISNNDYSINIYGDEDGKLFTLNNDTSGLKVDIRIASGTTISNLTFYPMLRLASDPDDTYQPYTMTNRELMEKKIDAELTFVTGVSIDTLTENKRYYCSGGMTGLPTGNIGYLDVHRARNGEGIHQTFYPAGTQGEIYVRRYWDNAWGSWYKFTGTVIS